MGGIVSGMRIFTTLRRAGAVAGLALLAACAQGPTEFDSYVEQSVTVGTETSSVRTPDERDQLASRLAAVGAQASAAGRRTPAPNALALVAAREEQAAAAAELVVPPVPAP
jgi:hypothetical protein